MSKQVKILNPINGEYCTPNRARRFVRDERALWWDIDLDQPCTRVDAKTGLIEETGLICFVHDEPAEVEHGFIPYVSAHSTVMPYGWYDPFWHLGFDHFYRDQRTSVAV